MKKLIPPFFISLFLLFIFVSPAQAVNLNGEWIAEKGARAELSQSGNTFSLIVTYSRFEKFIGTTAVKGTITGDTFIGQIYTYNDECPNLNSLVPAKGTISEEKIEIKFTRRAYDQDTCVRIPNSDAEGSSIYTRIITPSPEQQAEQQTQQSNQNFDKKELNDIFSFIPVLNLESIPQFVGLIGFDTITAPEQIKETTSIDFQELLNRKPTISATDENKVWTDEYKNPGQNDIIVIKGQGQLKPSNSEQSVTVSNTSKNVPAFGIFVDSIFTGNTSEMVQLKYSWLVDSGAVINVAPKTEIKFVKPAPGEAVKEARRMIMLDKGEIEVKVKNDNPENKFEVQTEILDLIVVGTHFWVSHDPDKKQTMVAVYEGKVEVKTKDGKTTLVSPNGNKSGVVVVTQKLSAWKLALAGFILAMVVAGLVFFIKRRNKTIRPKKTR